MNEFYSAKLTLVDWLTVSGNKVNEDCIGSFDGAAWVLDGATGLGRQYLDGPSDAAWFVAEVDGALKRHANSVGELPLEEILNLALRDVSTNYFDAVGRFPTNVYEAPSAGAAMVLVQGCQITVATFGDCKALIEDASGKVDIFGDDSLEKLDAKALFLLKTMRQERPAQSHQAVMQELQTVLRENREKMNSANGYWVLSLDPKVSSRAHIKQFTISHGRKLRILLATDGFTRLFDTFRVDSPNTLLKECFLRRGADLLQLLRKIENQDPECRKYPRFKKSDDASFICATVE